MTTTPTSGAAIQRYKIGYHSDEWGQRSSTPGGIPDASGSWVRYEDHVTALAAGQATAAPAQPAAQQGAADGFFLLLPQRPKPEAPAGTVGLDWDAYSGAQMLAFGRDSSDAAIAALRTEQPAPSGATEEVENLRKALVYAAFALHDAPQYMLAQGITLIDGDTVRVSRDGWTVEASVNPHRQPAPATQQAGEVRRAELVPGVMHCAKCKFQLNRVTLCVSDGNAYAGNNKTEPCPNGCGPLWPVTWEQEAKNCWKALEEMHERLMAAAAPQPSPTEQSADSVPAVSDLPPLPAPDLRDVGTKPQEIKEFLKGYATEYARTAIAARAPADSVQEDAARYRFLRDGEWRDTDLEPFIRLQLNTLWDAKIDAARKKGEKQ